MHTYQNDLKNDTPTNWQDVKKLGHSYITGGDIKWPHQKTVVNFF
jgi:hypothetical protein